MDERPEADAIVCTAIESDWGDAPPNPLMHPPCQCPRCAPAPPEEADDITWLKIAGQPQLMRVERSVLGDRGQEMLG